LKINTKLIVAIIATLVVVILLGIWMSIPIWNYENLVFWLFPESQNRNGDFIKLLLSIIGGLAVIYGLYLTLRRSKAMERSVDKQSEQIELSRKAQTDERFKNAIEHLSSDKKPIIIGGVAELHQIALSETKKYAEVVSEIFCEFIRRTTNVYEINREEIDSSVIQIMLDYLFPTSDESIGPYYHLKKNLAASDLRSMNLLNKSINNANFRYAKMPDITETIFLNSSFNHSVFDNNIIQKAVFDKCDFYNSLFHECTIYYLSFLNNHKWRSTKFLDCIIEYLDMKNCDIDHTQMFNCELNNCEITDTQIKGCRFVASNIFGLKIQSQSTHFQNSQFLGVNFKNFRIKCPIVALIFRGCTSNTLYRETGKLGEFLETHLRIENDLSEVSFPSSNSEHVTQGVLDEEFCSNLERTYDVYKRQLLYSEQHKDLKNTLK